MMVRVPCTTCAVPGEAALRPYAFETAEVWNQNTLTNHGKVPHLKLPCSLGPDVTEDTLT